MINSNASGRLAIETGHSWVDNLKGEMVKCRQGIDKVGEREYMCGCINEDRS